MDETGTSTDPNGDLALLRPEEVASKFQLAVRTVRFYALTQQIPAIRIGRSWRFRRSDMEAYLRRRSNEAGVQKRSER